VVVLVENRLIRGGEKERGVRSRTKERWEISGVLGGFYGEGRER